MGLKSYLQQKKGGQQQPQEQPQEQPQQKEITVDFVQPPVQEQQQEQGKTIQDLIAKAKRPITGEPISWGWGLSPVEYPVMGKEVGDNKYSFEASPDYVPNHNPVLQAIADNVIMPAYDTMADFTTGFMEGAVGLPVAGIAGVHKVLTHALAESEEEKAEAARDRQNWLDSVSTPADASFARKAGSLVGMMGTDPLTYLSFGASIPKTMLKTGAVATGTTLFKDFPREDMTAKEKLIDAGVNGALVGGLTGGILTGLKGLKWWRNKRAEKTAKAEAEAKAKAEAEALEKIEVTPHQSDEAVAQAHSQLDELDKIFGVNQVASKGDDLVKTGEVNAEAKAINEAQVAERQALENAELAKMLEPKEPVQELAEEVAKVVPKAGETADDVLKQAEQVVAEKANGARAVETAMVHEAETPVVDGVRNFVREANSMNSEIRGVALAKQLATAEGKAYQMTLAHEAEQMGDLLTLSARQAEEDARWVRPFVSMDKATAEQQYLQRVADMSDDIQFKDWAYGILKDGRKITAEQQALATKELQDTMDRLVRQEVQTSAIREEIAQISKELDDTFVLTGKKLDEASKAVDSMEQTANDLSIFNKIAAKRDALRQDKTRQGIEALYARRAEHERKAQLYASMQARKDKINAMRHSMQGDPLKARREALRRGRPEEPVQPQEQPQVQEQPYTDAADLLSRYSGASTKAGQSVIGGASGFYMSDEDMDITKRLGYALLGAGAMYGGGKGMKWLWKNGKKPFSSIKNKFGYDTVNGVKVARPLQQAIDKIGEWIYHKKLHMETGYMGALDNMLQMESRIGTLIETVRKALNNLSTAERAAMHNYMVGEASPAELAMLTPEVRRLADRFTSQIEALGQRAVDEGLLDADAFATWHGKYLRRIYTDHVDDAVKGAGGSPRTLSKTFSRGKEEMISYDKYKELEASGKIDKDITKEGNYWFEKEGLEELDKLQRLDDEALKKVSKEKRIRVRRDYTFDERTRMGEIRDASVSIPYTLNNLRQMLNINSFLKEVQSAGVAKAYNKADGILPGYKVINGRRYGALDGMQVPEAVAEDLKVQTRFLNGDERELLDLYKKALGLWKRSKTVYNPSSHINNMVGNWSLMVSQGMPMIKAMTGMISSMGKLAKFSKWQNLNGKVLTGKATPQEIALEAQLRSDAGVMNVIEAHKAGLFGGMNIKDIMYGADKLQPKWYQKPFKAFQNAYMGEDNMGRLAYYNWLKETAGLAENEAVKETRKIIPDYRLPMSKVGRFLRDTGLDPFISWTYYTMPAILKATNPLGKNMYGKGLNKYNAVNLAKLSAVLWGGSSIFSLLQGGQMTTPFFIPTEKPRTMQFTTQQIYKDPYGRMSMDMRMNYMFPQLGALSAGFSPIYKWFGEGDFTPFSDVGEMAKSHLTGGVPGTVLGLLQNEHPYTGYDISNQTGINYLIDAGGYLAGNLAPIPPWVERTVGGVLASKLRDDRDTIMKNPSLPMILANMFLPKVYKWDKRAYHYAEKDKKDAKKKNYGASKFTDFLLGKE